MNKSRAALKAREPRPGWLIFWSRKCLILVVVLPILQRFT